MPVDDNWFTPPDAPELETVTEDGAILYPNAAKVILGEAYKKGEKPPKGALDSLLEDSVEDRDDRGHELD